MPLPFPKLSEKCETHVCLVDNHYGDERWEEVLGISRDEKDRQCREEREKLETLYHQETEEARLNSLGGFVGTIKFKTKRFGVERRKCAIDERGILVMLNESITRIITSFRPIIKDFRPPQTARDFRRHALNYYKRLTKQGWGS
jgi:hypothetical protein